MGDLSFDPSTGEYYDAGNGQTAPPPVDTGRRVVEPVAQAPAAPSPAPVSSPPVYAVSQNLDGSLAADIANAAASIGSRAAGMTDYAITTSVEQQIAAGGHATAEQNAAIAQTFTNNDNVGRFSNAATSGQIQDWIRQISSAVASVPTPFAAPPVAVTPTPAEVVAAVVTPDVAPAPDPLAATVTSLQATVTGLQSLFTPAAPVAAAAPVTTTTTPAAGSTAQVNTSPDAASLAASLLQSAGALNAGSFSGTPGSGSVGGGVGIPDPTAGVTPLTANPVTSSGPSIEVVGVVIGMIALAFGIFVYVHDHHKKGGAAAVPA